MTANRLFPMTTTNKPTKMNNVTEWIHPYISHLSDEATMGSLIQQSGTNEIDTAPTVVGTQLATRLLIKTGRFIRDLEPAIKAGAADLLSGEISQNELLPAIQEC